jgi:hypothetical protein
MLNEKELKLLDSNYTLKIYTSINERDRQRERERERDRERETETEMERGKGVRKNGGRKGRRKSRERKACNKYQTGYLLFNKC